MIKSNTVINTKENKLCCGCGLCKVSCPNNAIEISFDKNKEYKPSIDKNKCNICGICLKICPMSINNLSLKILDAIKKQNNYGLENTIDCYVGYEVKEERYINSASGGILSALLIYLLEKKYIDAVVHAEALYANKNKKYFQAVVSTSISEINSRRSSFYYPIEFSTVLKEIKDNDKIKKFAFVGVPCVLSGMENLLKFDKILKEKLKYCFSLICSHNVSGQFADCLIRDFPYQKQDKKLIFRDKHGINNANNFNNLIELKNKKQIRKSRYESPFTIQWRSYSYAMNACFYCPDFFGVYSDAAFKDAWGFNNLSQKKGETVCVINNNEIKKIFSDMIENKIIYFKNVDLEKLKNSQSSTLDYKTLLILFRLKYHKNLFKKLKEQIDFHNSYQEERIFNYLDYLIKKTNQIYSKFINKFFYATSDVIIKINYNILTKLVDPKIKKITFFRKSYLKEDKSLRNVKIFYKDFIIYMLKFIKLSAGKILSKIPYIYNLLKHSLIFIALLKPDKLNKQILISGGHGYGNVGDEAQLAFNVKFIQDNYPDYEIVVLTPNTKYSRNHHNIDVELAPRVAFFNADRNSNYASSNWKFKVDFFLKLPRLLLNARLLYAGFPMFWINPQEARLLNSINKSSLILLSGGGYLTGMTLSRLWDNSLLISLGSAMNVPAVASGQTIGVFKDKLSPIIAKWGLKKLKFITVRDKTDSIEALSSIGIQGNHISFTFDDALFCEASSKSKINEILKRNGIPNDQPYIIVNAHYWGQKGELSNLIINEMADFCDKIADKENVNIVFLPMHKSDEKAETDIINKIKTKNVYLYKYDYDFKNARGLIKFSECCITMKHHPIVFSCGEGVPVISIAFDDYYKHKNIGALSLFGLEKNLIMSDGTNLCNDLTVYYNKVMKNKTKIVNHLHNCLKTYKKDAGKCINQFFDLYKLS